MSHHFDTVIDPTLDITDAYCFAGASDRFGPRTVFGMNTSPTLGIPWNPAGYVWGQVRDTTAAVVEARGTYGNPPHRYPTGRAYGAWMADTLFPNVLTFTPGTVALWDPSGGVHNVKGLTEEASDNMIKMVANEDFSSGLKPGPLLDHFPYVSPPPNT